MFSVSKSWTRAYDVRRTTYIRYLRVFTVVVQTGPVTENNEQRASKKKILLIGDMCKVISTNIFRR